jgi:hypothetical protein
LENVSRFISVKYKLSVLGEMLGISLIQYLFIYFIKNETENENWSNSLSMFLNCYLKVYFSFGRKQEAVERGLIGCIEVPFMIAKKAFELWPNVQKLAPIFNIQTKSDVLVAVKCLETGIYGAFENVKINCKDFAGVNKELVAKYYTDTEKMWLQSKQTAEEIIHLIDSRN